MGLMKWWAAAGAQSMMAVRRQAHINQSSKVKILLAEVRCLFLLPRVSESHALFHLPADEGATT